jgi:hypothetical protein
MHNTLLFTFLWVHILTLLGHPQGDSYIIVHTKISRTPLQLARKGMCIDALQQLHIQQYYHNSKLIPEQNLHKSNQLFELRYDTQARLTRS